MRTLKREDAYLLKELWKVSGGITYRQVEQAKANGTTLSEMVSSPQASASEQARKRDEIEHKLARRVDREFAHLLVGRVWYEGRQRRRNLQMMSRES